MADTGHFLDEIINRREVPALKHNAAILQRIYGDSELFPSWAADMDFKAPAVVVQALQQRLGHPGFGYETMPQGLIPALTGWFKQRHGWQMNSDHILRSPNILNALAMAASLFSEEDDGIIVQPPVFFDYFDILKENHRLLVSNPLVLEAGRYHMDLADLERKASDPRTRMIYLCNPHNPVGRVWTEDELRMLGDICIQHNVLVVADEIYADITFSGHDYTPFASLGPSYAEHCIVCLSPAKAFNIASCCSAFTVIANSELREAFQAENSRLTVNKNNAFSNVAMLAAYTGAGPWLDTVIPYLEQNVALVRDCLKGISGVELIEPEGTFLLWLDFRQRDLTPDELTSILTQKAKWAVSRGPAFGEQGTGFARINIACPKSSLEAALEQLRNAFEA